MLCDSGFGGVVGATPPKNLKEVSNEEQFFRKVSYS